MNVCIFPKPGCMDSRAFNFDPQANVACTSPPQATCGSGECAYAGCDDSLATNYNPLANAKTADWRQRQDGVRYAYKPATDDKCETRPVRGCMDSRATSYSAAAVIHDPTWCIFQGCTDSRALNFDAAATTPGECDMPVPG